MFGLTRTLRTFSLRAWIAEQSRRQRLKAKMIREINSLRHLSDDHLRDIGLYRSDIERYIMDLHGNQLWRRPRR